MFSEGPLPSIRCADALQYVLEVLKVPMNRTNWVLVGSLPPNLAFQLHIHLKSVIWVVFGFLKAAVEELPKETLELTTGTLTEQHYWKAEFALFPASGGHHRVQGRSQKKSTLLAELVKV